MHGRLLQAVEKMPAFPKSVQQVLLLASRADCSPRDLVEVIKNDPVFTLKIMRMVNSPFFGLAKEMNSVQQASVYLGLNTLKNIALGLAAVGALPRKNGAGFNMSAFWLHSLSVAAGAKLLAERLELTRDECADTFAAGLLHDVGKVVFALHAPEELKKALAQAEGGEVSLHDAEREHIGYSHTGIGQLLADHWGLPQGLADAIALHHEHKNFEDNPSILCVATANQMSKRLGYGFAGDKVVEPLTSRAEEIFGADLDGLIAELAELEDEVNKARVFIQLGEAAA